VEVCSNGVWGVYGGDWDSREATVVCRQLQYQHGSETWLELANVHYTTTSICISTALGKIQSLCLCHAENVL